MFQSLPNHGEEIISITIISKCDEEVDGAPVGSVVVRLPNVGRCDHSYAFWIYNHLMTKKALKTEQEQDPDEMVIFLKDDVSISNFHQSGYWRWDLEELLDIVAKNGFACGVETSTTRVRSHDGSGDDMYSMSIFHEWSYLKNFSLSVYERGEERYHQDSTDTFSSDFRNLGGWVNSVVDAEAFSSLAIVEGLVPTCYGGYFAARMNSAEKLGIRTWKAIVRSLERGDSIEEGHFAERTWGLLLSDPILPYQAAALREYSDAVLSNADSFYGTMLHEPSFRELAEINAKEVKSILRHDLPASLVDGADAKDNRPILVLLVGPYKHASTTTQCALALMMENLAKENYYYIGINVKDCLGDRFVSTVERSHGNFPLLDTVKSIEAVETTAFWETLESVLESHREANHNVIYSFEWLSEFDFDDPTFREAMLKLQGKWAVKIVTGYRHYHEWLPSLYHEIFKHRLLLNPYQDLWPEQGGPDVMPSFPECFSTDMRFAAESATDGSSSTPLLFQATYSNSLQVYSEFVKMFQDNVDVIDLQNIANDGKSKKDTMFSKFVCSLPNAAQSCEASKNAELKINNNNAASELHIAWYDAIAVAARDRGLVPMSATRREVRNAVMHHVEQVLESKVFDFPMKCLSKQQEHELVLISQTMASGVAKAISQEYNISALLTNSDSMSKKVRYCGVDVDKLFDDEDALLRDGRQVPSSLWDGFYDKSASYNRTNPIKEVINEWYRKRAAARMVGAFKEKTLLERGSASAAAIPTAVRGSSSSRRPRRRALATGKGGKGSSDDNIFVHGSYSKKSSSSSSPAPTISSEPTPSPVISNSKRIRSKKRPTRPPTVQVLPPVTPAPQPPPPPITTTRQGKGRGKGRRNRRRRRRRRRGKG